VCYEIDTEADLDRAKGFVERQLERTAFVSADSSAARRVSKNP
jgi:hypothetical protein